MFKMLIHLPERVYDYIKDDKILQEINKEYLKVTGIVTRLDKNARIIQIVNKKIHFDNIYDIQK